jgi:hypothetical protein
VVESVADPPADAPPRIDAKPPVFEMPVFDMPVFDMPVFDMPALDEASPPPSSSVIVCDSTWATKFSTSCAGVNFGAVAPAPVAEIVVAEVVSGADGRQQRRQ